jgi:flagellar FliL protein
MRRYLMILLSTLALAVFPAHAAEEAPAEGEAAEGEAAAPQPDIAYYTMQPDFVTNVATPNPSDRLHYVRVRVCLMLANENDKELVAGMEPAIQDTVMTVLGSKDFTQVASADGREKIRIECRDKIMSMLQDKLGSAVVQDVLFLSYMFQ